MLESIAGVFGLLAAAFVFALLLRALARRLRERVGEEAAVPRTRASRTPSATPTPSLEDAAATEPRETSGRTFLIAVVGFVLHAGSFYFYLWGAAAGSVGLTGLMVMLGVGFSLIVAIFYTWARGGAWVERGKD